MADGATLEAAAVGDEVRIDVRPGGVPAFIRPRDPALAGDLDQFLGWFSARKAALDDLAATHGALLFRGFPLADTRAFQRAIDHYPTNDMSYAGGAAPRAQIAERVFESTQALKQWSLTLHQEMAYLPRFPRMIAFFSRKSAWAGGETVMADFRGLEQLLPRAFWDEVKARGVRYERNFRAPGGPDSPWNLMHKTWIDAFGTEDRAEAEAACRSVGLEPVWREDGSLSTIYVAPGFIAHPKTGQTVWFNHIASQSLNARTLAAGRWEAYRAHYADGRPQPWKTTYGDGGAIAWEDLEILYFVLDSLNQSFRWQDQDMLLIDNIMTAHGRNPYEGERDLQVSLLG